MPVMARNQQRAELHRTIWGIADDVRGSVDAWDFKQYVLITLFYRYISEDLERFVNEWERTNGNPSPNYASMADADAEVACEAIVNARGYYIAPSMLFRNVLAHAEKDKGLNETIERIFKSILARLSKPASWSCARTSPTPTSSLSKQSATLATRATRTSSARRTSSRSWPGIRPARTNSGRESTRSWTR